MGSDIATPQEVKAKAEIISLLPQLKAFIQAQDTPEAQELSQEMETLYEMVPSGIPLVPGSETKKNLFSFTSTFSPKFVSS